MEYDKIDNNEELIKDSYVEKRMKSLVFTDLDGTLLDEKDYSFEPALEAIEQLKRLSIPIILCSSKTKGEIEFYRKKIGIQTPFIVENGGAIFVPQDHFHHHYSFDYSSNCYNIIKLGLSHSEIMSRLSDIKKELGTTIISLSELSPQEIIKFTALSLEEAILSKQREYGEPFIIDNLNSSEKKDFFEAIKIKGLQYTKGNIFFHLHGNNDKGKAVRKLIEMYVRDYHEVLSVGLGDSPNDLPMLQSVDIPILIRKRDLSYNKEIKQNLPDIFISTDVGPSGWNKMIFAWLNGSLKKPSLK